MALKQLETPKDKIGYIKLLEQLSPGDTALEVTSNITKEIFLYKINSVILGTASLIVENKPTYGGSKVGHIEDVVVDEKHRRKGHGCEMMRQLIDYAAACGCRKIVLSCNIKNIQFYKKCGFRQHETTMRLDIHEQ